MLVRREVELGVRVRLEKGRVGVGPRSRFRDGMVSV